MKFYLVKNNLVQTLILKNLILLTFLTCLQGCKVSNLWIGRDLDIICKSHRDAFTKVQAAGNPKELNIDLLSLTYWQNMENGVKSEKGKDLIKTLSMTEPTKRYSVISMFAQKNSKVFDCLEIRELYVYLHQIKLKK